MKNIYICFESLEERRSFVKTIIELNAAQRKETSFIKKTRNEALNSMEQGRTHSPYYKLHRNYYLGIIPELPKNYKYSPYNGLEVFKNGFRSIYYQKSYASRPGNWLVIQVRQTELGRKIQKYIKDNIPEESIGTNVPLPEKVVAKNKMVKVRNLLTLSETQNLEAKVRNKYLDTCYKILLEILLTSKELFKGDDVYLWERLAFLFHQENKLDKMESCLRKQSNLQNDASPFLNMGVFFHLSGKTTKAIQSYKEGLELNPHDEYLIYNLKSLLYEIGDTNYSLLKDKENDNITTCVNYVLLGNIYFYNEDYKQAIDNYVKALLESKEMVGEDMIIQVYRNLIEANYQLGNTDLAKKILNKARKVFPNNSKL
ncbi:tetratricopeptide repeat protein [Natranaerobius trueperi]|uniref:Uncharacterized protein n=1 Tax=Natranaerobius trueperi TaxID=759412 RepID=A0A226BYV2_9FIRM|nr:hypothetical protein [Natranaerobius trueperi]OWZ84105.1 hypothetical protein CDO51_05160 [Natranaerobius trueperi]